MTSDQSRDLVKGVWQAFSTRDPEQIAPYFHEDAQWLAPAANGTAVALGGSHRMIGRAAIVTFISHDFGRLFAENVSIDFRGFYADGDTVIVEETMTATLANGNQYVNEYCFVFELRDGLIRQVREYMDTAKGTRMIFGEAPAAALPV
jgi:ketosteroid isomerase-like protein